MRFDKQYLAIYVLIAVAIVVFGVFIVVNLTQQPESPAATAEATQPPEGTAEATGEATQSAEEMPQPEATDSAGSGETTTEEAGEGSPTPTSMSRVTQSILIGTQVTPALQGGVPGAAQAPDSGGETEGSPTPTSMSRVTQSILIGADGAPEAGQTPEATPESTAEMTEEATAEATDEVALAAPTSVPGQPVDSPSALQPRGPVAQSQANLWWLMLGIGTVIYIFVSALVLFTVFRRRSDQEDKPVSQREERVFIFGGGVAMPLVILTILFALTLSTMAVLSMSNQSPELVVEVIGHQWWWEVRYPNHEFVTANEIHIPVGQPVRFDLTSADVIHSFWVPELGGKLDLIPARTNTFWLQADEAGEYRGQCAEFCGIQHANMAMLVIAEESEAFNQWLDQQSQPAHQPQDELTARGQEVVLNSECIACHTIRGTNASGVQGPDLTHFGSRRTIGAATLPNTMDHLAQWIANSQVIKPGNLMPAQPLAGQDLEAAVAYLESLQ